MNWETFWIISLLPIPLIMWVLLFVIIKTAIDMSKKQKTENVFHDSGTSIFSGGEEE